MGNRRIASVQKLLEAEIAGLIPVATECRPDPAAPPGAKFPFFEGRPDEMRLRLELLASGGRAWVPACARVRVIQGEKNEGVRLIVNELFYTGPQSPGHAMPRDAARPGHPENPCRACRRFRPEPASFVLADRLA